MNHLQSTRASRLPALSLLAACALACSQPATPGAATTPPRPDTSQLERSLVLKLEERSAAVEAAPDSAEAWGRLGVVFEIHDLLDEAVRCYERAQALDPEDYRWPFFLGTSKRIGDQEQALAHFERARELRPDYAPLSAYVGLTALLRDDLAGARAGFERALELDPNLVVAHLGLGKVALAEGNPEDAVERFEFALALGPRTAEVRGLLAQAYRLLGDQEQADFHAGLAPRNPVLEPVRDGVREELMLREGVTLSWRRTRTEQYLRENNLASLKAEWEYAIRLDPENPQIELEAGHALSRIGRSDLAIPHYERAIELEPEMAQAWFGKANALYETRRIDEAIAAAERSLELDPTLHEARVNLGAMKIDSGDGDTGLALIQSACQAMPDNADARYNLAKAYQRLDRTQDAMRTMQEALEIAPAHVRAHFDYGLLLFQSSRLEEAKQQFRQIVSLRPGLSSGYLQLARVLRAAGDPAAATGVLEEGLERVGRDEDLLADLAWTLATSPDDAVRDGARAVELATELCSMTRYENPNALQILGAAHAEAGDFEQAIGRTQAAEKLLSEQTLTPPLRSFLIQVQRRLSRYREGKPFRDLE